ncbi:MAG: tetratricopeptide repeat protein [Armatimonadota bacterium]
MSSQLDVLVSESTDLVNSGQFAEALTKADAALAIDPSSPGASLARAVCLSQLGNSSEASQAFDKAIGLAPGDPKARFNAAVHEYNLGNLELARSLAKQAVDLDANHEGAKGLLQRIPVTSQQASYPRDFEMADEVQPAGLPFITKMGSGWVLLGWIISIAALAFFIMDLGPLLEGIQAGMAAKGDPEKIKQMQAEMAGKQNMVLATLGLGVRVLTVLWGLLDLIHRKGNMVWLIPHLPCSCCGFGWLTLPIYILFGRK